MNSYLQVLKSLCNKVHVQCHSEIIVLEEEKNTVLWYEIGDLPLKTVKNLTLGKKLEKGKLISRMLGYCMLQLGLLE